MTGDRTAIGGVGVGVDVIAIQRIGRLLRSYPEQFREFAFSSAERAYCDDQVRPAQHYAGRWAIKEAFLKAIDAGDAGLDLASIEVRRTPSLHLELDADALDRLQERAGATGKHADDVDVAISLSHDESAGVAIGMVVVLY